MKNVNEKCKKYWWEPNFGLDLNKALRNLLAVLLFVSLIVYFWVILFNDTWMIIDRRIAIDLESILLPFMLFFFVFTVVFNSLMDKPKKIELKEDEIAIQNTNWDEAKESAEENSDPGR